MLKDKDIKIILFSNYILISMVRKGKEGKIITPETVKKPLGGKDFDAVVVKVSEEMNDNKPMVKNIKIGDIVCLSANSLHSGQIVMMHKKEFFMVRETDVVGVFQEGYDEGEGELKMVIPPSEAVN